MTDMKKILFILPAFFLFLFIGCNPKQDTQDNSQNTSQEVSQEQINRAANAMDGAKATFEFQETDHDFGTINEGELVKHVFTFKNIGEAPLIIRNAQATCGCTVPEWPKQPVAVGETGEILVQFNSNNRTNIQHKVVTITANTDPATTRLTIKANVLPKDQQTAGPVRK
jgi:hypothetical protein